MSGTKLNRVIAAGIALVNAIIPFLVLIGAVSLSPEGVAGAMGIVSLAGTFVGLLFAQSDATNV